MASWELYVVDANGLIQLHRHFGKRALRRLGKMAAGGTLRLPEGIVREVLRRTDRLAQWVKKHQPSLEVRFRNHPGSTDHLSRIERTYGEYILIGKRRYPGFWSSPAGRKSADAQVVAVAIVVRATVVSDDQAVRLACSLEGVPCIGWAEFARRIELVLQPRLPSP
jgi:hypothetical protein